jgi:hypothetical protein
LAGLSGCACVLEDDKNMLFFPSKFKYLSQEDLVSRQKFSNTLREKGAAFFL